MDVCALTLAFLKVSMRVYGVCMEHIACHLGHFTPLRVATYSICTWSLYYFFRRLCAHYIAPWDSGNSATMSFRNLNVYHGDSYGSHRISIYTAHRRSAVIPAPCSFTKYSLLMSLYQARQNSIKNPHLYPLLGAYWYVCLGSPVFGLAGQGRCRVAMESPTR